jgi:hypothetical protein
MERVPAISGWVWIKRGFALFRQQPSEMATLFVLCCCLKLFLSVIPVIGLILSFVLIPAFSMAFMVACDEIEQGKRVHPRVLFAGFRGPAMRQLAALGACYLAAFLGACVVMTIVDGGYLWQTLSKQVSESSPMDVNSEENLRMAKSVFVLVITYLLAILPLWFATPLIAWQKMPLGKAIFFSFFSVVRAIKAFALYALCWFFIAMLTSYGVGAVLKILQISNLDVGLFILMPIYLLLGVIMYCSYYSSYTQIFGTPERQEER